MALKPSPIHMVTRRQPWGRDGNCFLGSALAAFHWAEGLPALGRAAPDEQMPTTWRNNSPTQSPCPQIPSCYINCITDTLKKLSGLFIPKQLFTRENTQD